MRANESPSLKSFEKSSLLNLFDEDFALTIKDRILAPLYIEMDLEKTKQILTRFDMVKIERLTRYPGYKNIRRFLSPLYNSYHHPLAKLLYGDGNIQLKARKKI